MAIIHFLNVNDGDCSIIQHNSGHVTVIDVCNAKHADALAKVMEQANEVLAVAEKGVNGNFNQKQYPVNPILYIQDRGLARVFRFILTHPDMDHMDGIEALFGTFTVLNFWDTDNNAEKTFDEGTGGYAEADWKFYKQLRDRNPQSNPKRLTLYSGAKGQYWNMGENADPGGDGLQILAPTKPLVLAANEAEDYNDCSYVILYRTGNFKILFAGDSHDATWEHILNQHESTVSDVDLLIAPHHGRRSDRDWEFLDVVNPSLTLFGNAGSEHLAYDAWNNRGLPFITNNQAGCVVINAEVDPMDVYVTCQAFAQASNPDNAGYSTRFKAYYLGEIVRADSPGR